MSEIPAGYEYLHLPLDLQIAAQAITRNCILVTNNQKEFKRVKGLEMENWVE